MLFNKQNTLSALGLLLLAAALPAQANDTQKLTELSTGAHRSAENIARNAARHPVETLEFFGLHSGMTVIEILPGGGWYTEILAPFLKGNGTYYAAHFSPNATLSYMPPNRAAFDRKLAANPDLYGETKVTSLFPPSEVAIAPPNSADLAMTFRNVHNWVMAGTQHEHFASFYKALKPGGILGVVEHRAPEGSTMEFMQTSGYVTQAYTIELALAAGFEFVGSSEINANPKDLKNYAQGVWTLPPNLRLGDQDRAKYTDIGESDRMTLKFSKPMQ